MGIRFACHECGKRLNVKRELAGKRGVCPECSIRFRIPREDAEKSTALEDRPSAATRQHAGTAVPSAASDSASSAVAMASESAVTVRGGPSSSTEDLLVGDPTSTWYVRPPTGGQYGPASPDVFRDWIDQGRVAATSLIWRDGWPQWRVASEVLPDLIKPAPGPDRVTASAISSPAQPDRPAVTDPDVSFDGRHDVGVVRRSRSGRRIAMIAALFAIAILLIVVLAIILNRG